MRLKGGLAYARSCRRSWRNASIDVAPGSGIFETYLGSCAFNLVAKRSIVNGPKCLLRRLKSARLSIQSVRSRCRRLSLSARSFFLPGMYVANTVVPVLKAHSQRGRTRAVSSGSRPPWWLM